MDDLMGILFVKIMAKMFELNITSLYEMAILCLACKYSDTGLFMSNDGLAKDLHASRRSIINSINRLRKNGYLQYESTGYGKRVIKANSAIVALYNEDNGEKVSPLDSAIVALSGSATVSKDSAIVALYNEDIGSATSSQDSASLSVNSATVSKDSAIVAPITKLTEVTENNRRIYTTPTSPKISPIEITVYWNSKTRLPKIRGFTDDRKRKLSVRSMEPEFFENWKQLIDMLDGSDFHTGSNDRGWVATIDYLIRNTKYQSLLESPPKNKTSKKEIEYEKSMQHARERDEADAARTIA